MFVQIFTIIFQVQFLCTLEERVITSLKYSRYRIKPTVVNGEPARSWQVPYLVSIKEPIASKEQVKLYSNLCGGSIVRPKYVLTAAHCFESNRFHYAKRPYVLRAIAGNENTDLYHTGASGVSKSGAQWRRLIRVFIHKHFLFPDNDIALVVVDYPFDLNSQINAVTLAKSTTDNLGACITAGYGRTGHRTSDRTSKILLLAQIDTMSRDQCSILWEMNMDNFICSKSVRTDVSEGDSGGPLACVHSLDPTGYDGRDLLMGIVSGKNFDRTTLFTRVSAYNDWVNRVITTGSQNVACNSNYRIHFPLIISFVTFCASSW